MASRVGSGGSATLFSLKGRLPSPGWHAYLFSLLSDSLGPNLHNVIGMGCARRSVPRRRRCSSSGASASACEQQRSCAVASMRRPAGWPPATSPVAIEAPETGSSAGSGADTNRMNKPDGGDFAHISRFFPRLPARALRRRDPGAPLFAKRRFSAGWGDGRRWRTTGEVRTTSGRSARDAPGLRA